MNFLELISNALGAVKEFFGYARQRDTEKNTPQMLQAKEAAEETRANDQTREAIAKGDLDELRKEAAE